MTGWLTAADVPFLALATALGLVAGWWLAAQERRPDARLADVVPGQPAAEHAAAVDVVARETADAASRLADRLADRRAAELALGLEAARGEAARLRVELVAAVDAKDAEIGRIETAAVTALDGTVASLEDRIARLGDELTKAYERADRAEAERDAERRAAQRLQAALAEALADRPQV